MIKNIFDIWAQNGHSEIMANEHSKTVLQFLQTFTFDKKFSFLDIGCGNGWIIRYIAKFNNCINAVGIDTSINMIKNAHMRKNSNKENYIAADIKHWNPSLFFDYVFSMESLYYIVPMEIALINIHNLLKPSGKFICGTDFYSDNKASLSWPAYIKKPMDLRSLSEWKKMFKNIGFKINYTQIQNPHSNKSWKRKLGTFFIVGTKL